MNRFFRQSFTIDDHARLHVLLLQAPALEYEPYWDGRPRLGVPLAAVGPVQFSENIFQSKAVALSLCLKRLEILCAMHCNEKLTGMFFKTLRNRLHF